MCIGFSIIDVVRHVWPQKERSNDTKPFRIRRQPKVIVSGGYANG